MSLYLEKLKTIKTSIRLVLRESTESTGREQELLPITMNDGFIPRDTSILTNMINNKNIYNNDEVYEFKKSILLRDNTYILSQEKLMPLLYEASDNFAKNNVLITFIDNLPRDIRINYIKAISANHDSELEDVSTTFAYCLASLKKNVPSVEILQGLLHENLNLYYELNHIAELVKKISLIRTDALNGMVIDSVTKALNTDIDGDETLEYSQKDERINFLNKKLLITAAILGISFLIPQVPMLSLSTISLISKYIDTGG